MTRPSIIRADTIDLQDHHAPSAKDQSHPNLGESSLISPDVGPIAPHQAETLREVAQETAVEEARSPRVSLTNGEDAGRFSGPGDTHQQLLDATNRMYSQQEQHLQDDALAVAQNGGISSSDEGDLDGDGDDDLDDDMMDRISSSPSIEDEDIDFEFVYALHTFVATVEGQANATKGDTMVLLDDSNSYWWLVRVVKDSSIGYLPAEHIETPTERLARLNKHRNIDLSAAMLGDQAAKQKTSSAFKAIRKKRKNVTFTEPTYVDYSDFDYSTDEEDIDELFGPQPAGQQKGQSQQEVAQDASAEQGTADETAKVEPLKTRPTKEAQPTEQARANTAEDTGSRSSDELLDVKAEGPSRSKNGTVRNTDSFFKDESLETKKITLTPNLLRDDGALRQSSDSANKDLKTRTSLERVEKELVADKKKSKDKDKREREKKPSAIRSFFSRKDKKKTSEDDDESFGKRSMDNRSDSRESDDRTTTTTDDQPSPDRNATSQRSPTKLQKPQSRVEPSPAGRAPSSNAQKSSNIELSSYLAESRTNDVSNVPPSTMRIVDPETKEKQEVSSSQPKQDSSSPAAAQREDNKSVISKIMPIRSASSASDVVKPQKTIKAKSRMELDASDSSEAEEALMKEPTQAWRGTASTESQKNVSSRPQLPGAFPDSAQTVTTMATIDEATPHQALHDPTDAPSQAFPLNASSNPPALVIDTSSQEEHTPEGSPSPELIQSADEPPKSSSSASKEREASWDDAKLRTFFDEGDHIRDLLAVVYDKSDVVPAGPDHPVVGGLFREQNAKLAEITTQLDNMLGDWLARKQRLRGAI